MAIKNDLDVFYFACVVPYHVLFTEDGQMDKRVFLQAWKDIPAQNEVQYTIINGRNASPGTIFLIFLDYSTFSVFVEFFLFNEQVFQTIFAANCNRITCLP